MSNPFKVALTKQKQDTGNPSFKKLSLSEAMEINDEDVTKTNTEGVDADAIDHEVTDADVRGNVVI